MPRLANTLSVMGRGEADGLVEEPCGMAAAMPSDLSHRLPDRQVGLPQQPRHALGTQRRQIRHGGLAVGLDEHTTELRSREVNCFGK